MALDGLDRHDDDVILVAAKAALPAGGENANDFAAYILQADSLADRIVSPEKVGSHGVSDNTDRFPRLLFGRHENASLQQIPPLGREIIGIRSEEHTSELQSLMRISYAVFCLKKKTYTPPLTSV